MKNLHTFEEFLFEGVWSDMMKGVRKGESGPWTIVVIDNKKVVDQDIVKIQDLIPARYESIKKKYPKAKIHIEDTTGMVVWQGK